MAMAVDKMEVLQQLQVVLMIQVRFHLQELPKLKDILLGKVRMPWKKQQEVVGEKKDVVVEVEGYMEDMPTLAMEMVLAVQVLVEAAMLEI